MKSDYLGILSSIKKDINDSSKSQDDSISLIVVTKSQSIDDIRKVIDIGYKNFGENYVDEGIEKINSLNDESLEWHFIGKIQSNKIKKICKNFDWVQTVSTLKHARSLNKACLESSKKINICF